MQEILWLTKNRMNRALSTVAFFAVPVSRNDAGSVPAILSVIEIPVCVVGMCVDLAGAMFLGRKAKSPLARACSWCPEESRSRRRDPGIRNIGCPSSPDAAQAVVSLSGLKRKGQLALALLIWCPEESRSRRRDPGIRSTGCPSSPVAKQAVVSLSGHEKIAHLRELFSCFWCPEEDSNLHTLRHTDLNRARLPIPPSGQAMFLAEDAHFIAKGKFVNEKEK